MTDGIFWVQPGHTILSIAEDQRGPAMQTLADILDEHLAKNERPDTVVIGDQLYAEICAECGISAFCEMTINHRTRGVTTVAIVPTGDES